MEAIQQFGPNVVGFQMVTGERQWYIIGFYLAPDNTLTIESVVAALKYCPQGSELLVVGYLNAKLEEPEGYRREEETLAELTAAVLEEILAHFLPRRCPWCRGGRTCSMVQMGREVRSWTGYILWKDHCLFRIVAIRDPRHNSDHYMVLGCIRSASLR